METSDIKVVEVPTKTAVAERFKVPMAQIGEVMGRAFGQIMQFISAKDLQPAGMPFATYPSMKPDEEGN